MKGPVYTRTGSWICRNGRTWLALAADEHLEERAEVVLKALNLAEGAREIADAETQLRAAIKRIYERYGPDLAAFFRDVRDSRQSCEGHTRVE